MTKYRRTVMYVAAIVVLVSGVMAHKQTALALPTSGLVSFCIAAKAGSRNPLILPAVLVGVAIALLTVAANNFASGAASQRFADVAVAGAVLLIFLRTRARGAPPVTHLSTPSK
jgi:hypothetical protein